MPTYSYRCTTCGHRFDAVQKFTDAALTECPECGGDLRKVFHAAGVVFKGSGWYINDSRNGSTGARTESKTPASGSDSSSTTKPADSTKSEPAAKAEPATKSAAAD